MLAKGTPVSDAPIQPELTIDESQLMRLQSAMMDMQRATGASMKLVVRNTARDMAFEMIRRTPIAKRWRSMRLKGTQQYYIRLYHRYTRERIWIVGSAEQAEKYGDGRRRPIRGRGYAKASFIRVLRGLGLPERRPVTGQGRRRDPASWSIFVSRLEQTLDPSMTIGSSLPYIGKLDDRADIVAGAVRAVEQKMLNRSRRIMEQNTARAMTRAGITAARIL